MTKKKNATIFLILALFMVLFFTLQEPEQSRGLSEVVRIWLGKIGITVGYKSLRSNIHILEYFIVGLALCRFCRSRDWKVWFGTLIGCCISVVDEGIKVLLPGREFEIYDLLKNCLGVLIAVSITIVVMLLKKREV